MGQRESSRSEFKVLSKELAFKNHSSGSFEDRHLTKSRLFWKPRLECVGRDVKDLSSEEWGGVLPKPGPQGSSLEAPVLQEALKYY